MANVIYYDPADANVPDRVTSYLKSVNTPSHDKVANTIVNPDLSAVAGVDQKYWKKNPGPGPDVIEMDAAEKEKVDIELLGEDPASITKLDLVKQIKILEVKTSAYRRIAEIPPKDQGWLGFPEWKQRNLTARSLELVKKMVDNPPLTAGEQTELTDIEGLWTQVVAIRDATTTIEGKINALGTVAEVEAFDVEADPAWPK